MTRNKMSSPHQHIMNGMLLTPVRSIKERPHIFEAIVKAFQKSGHKLNTGVLEATEAALGEMKPSELVTLYQKIQSEMHRSSFIVCEISSPSSGIGFLVAQAINDHKPVLALVQSGSSRAPLPLLAKDTKFMSFYNYDTPDDIDLIVQGFLRKIKTMVDYRFVLLLPPNIDNYLDWSSSQRRLAKSEVIRRAIEIKIKEDEQYQQFIQEEKTFIKQEE